VGTPSDTQRFADVLVRKRRAWMLAPLFFPSLLDLVWSAFAHVPPWFTLVIGVLGFLVIPAALAYRKWPARRRGEVSVDARALRLDGEIIFERRTIKQAVMFPEDDGFVVRVTSRRYISQDLRVATAAEGERLLAVLEQSEAQVTATFPCTYGGAVSQWGVFGATVGSSLVGGVGAIFFALHAARHSFLPLVFTFTPVVLMVAALWTRTCKVTVGADGIAIRRPLRKARFLPFSEVREVHREKSDVVVSLVGERAVRFGCHGGSRRLTGADADAAVLALLQRIEDARNRAGDEAPVAARALLARGSLGRAEWRRRVDQLGEEAGSYRVSAVPAGELWKVLADPRETAEVRAAAALAVRRTLDDAGRERVRIAASTIAEAPLRRVFTAVNGGNEAEIEEALDELEGAEAPRAARMS
jgi:hypothetical protein